LPAPRDDLLAHPLALASTGDQSNLLKADFQSHWAPDNNMPALLLNTTDVLPHFHGTPLSVFAPSSVFKEIRRAVDAGLHAMVSSVTGL
jgi:hypothetical protein